MTRAARSNPLALAVLIALAERPMHPYEVATTLRQRNKHESVRLNYGSLYAVVESLHRRGLIEPQETVRSGRLPERTVYRPTEAGLEEIADWLTELLSMPRKEYPAFEAALSFLPALPPETVGSLLEERAQRLERDVFEWRATRELVEQQGLPRLFWVEAEFAGVLKMAELEYVRHLAADIREGTLDGLSFWRAVHQGDAPIPLAEGWPAGFEHGLAPGLRAASTPSDPTEEGRP